MPKLQELRAELERLEQSAAEIGAQGKAILEPDFRLDTSTNGRDSASGETVRYRLRWNDQSRNPKSQTISKAKYDELWEAIERGRKLKRVKKQIQTTRTRLERAIATARELGLL